MIQIFIYSLTICLQGFSLSFLTQLDRTSHPLVEQMICQHILSKVNIKSILKQPLPEPGGKKHLNFEGYWISCGTQEPSVPEHYILTPSVRANLKDLARVVSAGWEDFVFQSNYIVLSFTSMSCVGFVCLLVYMYRVDELGMHA